MIDQEIVNNILEKLVSLAVPMEKREFTNDEYNRVFSRGTVITPVGEVKLGKNQFSKMAEKDGGTRKSLIGAMRQTLSDPVVIIKESEGDRKADVFIKSFTAEEESKDTSLIVAVVVSIEETKVVISTYKRKRREVVNKIKKADGIVYIKDNGGSLTNEELSSPPKI